MDVGILFVGSYLPQARNTRGASAELADRLARRGWRVLTTSHRVGRIARLADAVATAVRRRREYAVAHVDVYSGRAFAYAEVLCATLRLLGKPVVLTLHGGRLPEFAARRPRRVARLLRAATAVTAPSGYLAAALGQFRPDLQVLPNAIDVHQYPFRSRTPARPRLVWLRAFHGAYDPSLAVRALARLVRRLPDAHLRMIGPDKGDGSLEEVRAVVASEGLDGRVEIVGPVAKSDVGARLDEADIFVNTTTVDNTPVSLIEAMAAGLCIVTTDVGGIRHLVTDGREALLVRSGDADGMADAIERIVRDPELAERLSRAARARAEQMDWTAVLPRWEALLHEAVTTLGPSPRPVAATP